MAGLLANQVQGKQLEAPGFEHALALVRQVALNVRPMAARAVVTVSGPALIAVPATRAAHMMPVVKVMVWMWHG
jgi:anti-sigma factor ChrR (cupin superfamily)